MISYVLIIILFFLGALHVVLRSGKGNKIHWLRVFYLWLSLTVLFVLYRLVR